MILIYETYLNVIQEIYLSTFGWQNGLHILNPAYLANDACFTFTYIIILNKYFYEQNIFFPFNFWYETIFGF